MSDQAERLRELMHATAARPSVAHGGIPRLVAMAGAKGGVGTTTIAVNVAIAMVQRGDRTLLVDADPQRAGVATQCGLIGGDSIGEFLSDRRSLRESICRGPGGIRILAGRWAAAVAASPCTDSAQQRFVDELKGLDPSTGVVLLEVGAVVSLTAKRFWRAADEVVLVTTPDSASVMEGYAAIKALADASAAPRIVTLVNQAVEPREAQDAHDRLQRACRRFLGIDVRAAGLVPHDAAARVAADSGVPLLAHAPDCPAATAIANLAARWHSTEAARQVSTCVQAASPRFVAGSG
jgi:flagellar biosynthesis protein FlhG